MSTARPARQFPARLCAAVLALSLFSACSGGGSSDAPAASVSVPQVDFGPASNVDGKLRPVPNGFAFPNFAAASAPGNTFAGADLAAMFGDGPDVCASGTGDACSPTAEAASWAQMVNESRQSGHCEGFIVQSLSRFEGGITPEAAQLSTSTEVVQGILRGFATQFIPETRSESKGWRKTKVRDILAELVTSLRDGVPNHVLGVYGDAGGHAILPYAVEFSSAEKARVQVYDSNWPGRNRFVDFDLAAGTWTFSFQGQDPENDPSAWTGGDGDMDLSSLGKRLTGTCPFCGDGATALETMLTIRASAPTWSLETERGTVTPGSTVDGVDVSQTRAAINGVFEYVVTVDPAVLALEKKNALSLTLPPKSVAYAVTPKGIARAATSAASGTIGISGDTVTSKETTTGLRLAAGDEVIAADGLAAEISVTDAGVSGKASAAGGASVDASTTDDNRAILLTLDGNKPAARELEVTTKEDLPPELIGSVTATDLPPAAARELANITPDAPYVLPVVATTTTQAATTTAAPVPGATTTTVKSTATTKPPTGVTTTVAVTGGTTTIPSGTSSPTTVPATTSPPTTSGPTTTVNSAPNVSSFTCTTMTASELDVIVVASDANGDSLTYTFEKVSGLSSLIPNPQTVSHEPGQPTRFKVVGGYVDGSNSFKVTVSDGSLSGARTSTFTLDMMANSC
jgi:hypothetical protein